jgi:hypothetical protein
MERITTLEKNGPIIAAEIRDRAGVVEGLGYTVVSLAYDRQRCRVFRHRALKAAIRRACSMNAGKLRVGGEFALAIVCPDGHVRSIREALELR